MSAGRVSKLAALKVNQPDLIFHKDKAAFYIIPDKGCDYKLLARNSFYLFSSPDIR